MTKSQSVAMPDAVIHLDETGVYRAVRLVSVSVGTKMDEVVDAVEESFAGGAQAVYVISPRLERVYAYSSPTHVRVLTRADELTGDPVIPGFRLPLADLFPPPDPAAP